MFLCLQVTGAEAAAEGSGAEDALGAGAGAETVRVRAWLQLMLPQVTATTSPLDST